MIPYEHIETYLVGLAEKEILTRSHTTLKEECEEIHRFILANPSILQKAFPQAQPIDPEKWSDLVIKTYTRYLRQEKRAIKTEIRTMFKQGGLCDSCDYFTLNTLDLVPPEDAQIEIDIIEYKTDPIKFDPDCVLYPGKTYELEQELNKGKRARCKSFKPIPDYHFLLGLQQREKKLSAIENLLEQVGR